MMRRWMKQLMNWGTMPITNPVNEDLWTQRLNEQIREGRPVQMNGHWFMI
ncbi:MAG TPA: hypothetical protein PK637_16785 [Flavobacteriales bacterium]|nr:hypothetical protein [Flavobacteriales bacterium]HRE98424.1 hypothetical protein [Flavobacteriales bacterium]HRJ36311.1 hypothetical protein [Flavobacteriales bacterium]HRJ38214.1 hypothetical protein [Flavobacteriales bacterium]